MNEYFTSKKCPGCKQFVAQTENIRRFYCGSCGKYMHRDIMAGHNMVNILRSYVEDQERPDYLHPVDENGTFPWKKQDSKNLTPKTATSTPADPGRHRKRRGEEPDEMEKDGKRRRDQGHVAD